jgi:hypothetical protein
MSRGIRPAFGARPYMLQAPALKYNYYIAPTLPRGQGSTGLSGFTPDAGYQYTTKPVVDTPGFIIKKPAGGFGAVGPIQSLFDDFRGGTAGNSFANPTTPVYGDQSWSTGSGHPAAIYGSPNRSGGGQTMRIVIPTDSTDNPRQEAIVWAGGQQIQQIYWFWAENPNGTDYNTIAHNRGNDWNYKMHWLLYNNHTTQCCELFAPTPFYQGSGPNTWALAYGNNDGGAGAFPSFYPGNPSQFAPSSWNSMEVGIYADVANPTSSPGTMYFGMYNSEIGGYQHDTTTNNATSGGLFLSGSGTNGPWDYANQLNFPGIIQGFPVGIGPIDKADIYVTIGPNCFNRFMMSDQSTIGLSTKMMPFTIDTTTQGVAATGWTDTQVSMTPRAGWTTGSFAGNHLWWCDINNSWNHCGVFD